MPGFLTALRVDQKQVSRPGYSLDPAHNTVLQTALQIV